MEETGRKQEIKRCSGDRLVNEAIKRILLDIVIRGHGDRLIGRWSREPELQSFLEQVPYMLDRINQLHLACTRHEPKRKQVKFDHHNQHHYHHHHSDTLLSSSQSALSDFINLVGEDRHWLVRTRDPLGLTPLHKAVLFDNVPIVEYILDRYPDELAASGGVDQTVGSSAPESSQRQSKKKYLQNGGATRLIDAQDKYGRSATHYAAAQLAGNTPLASSCLLYQFLVAKGASLTIQDFRGKTPPDYVRHPNQLRSKSIIHLANKLNANYQANVLSRTLRASSERAAIDMRDFSAEEPKRPSLDDDWRVQIVVGADGDSRQPVECNRESMSVSCNDLTNCPDTPSNVKSAEQHKQHLYSNNENEQRQPDRKRSQSTVADSSDDYAVRLYTELPDSADRTDHSAAQMKQQNIVEENQATTTAESQSLSPLSQGTISIDDAQQVASLNSNSSSNSSKNTELKNKRDPNNDDAALKELISDRCPGGMVIDERTKQLIRRTLSSGAIERINELLADGYGNYLLSEASVSCWNQQCKRYINQIIPNLLGKVDTLHEFIAANQLLALKSLLNKDPILARIRRPYKRAAMSALHVAVWRDRRTIVKYLVGRFPELVSQCDSHGATCLHWAAKCLRHDRLYGWLLERFGHQLEQVRDRRGKTALDYRQQAFRLSNFPENRPKTNESARVHADDIMRTNQQASDRLQLRGSKINMKTRSKPTPPTTTCTTIRVAAKTGDRQLPATPLSAVGVDASSRCSTEMGDLDKSIEIEIDSASSKAKGTSSATRLEANGAPTGSSANGPINKSPSAAHVSFVEQNPDRSEYGSPTESLKTHHLPVEEPSSNGADLSQELLSELAQLDSAELQADRNGNNNKPATVGADELVGSPPATPSLPLSRPQSASFSGKLERMIEHSIERDDFKKLEHLILAGCGRKVVKLYDTKFLQAAQDDNNINSKSQLEETAKISVKMREFCEKRAREYMDKMSLIHSVLHRCYAGSLGSEMGAEMDANSAFHKLCSLLDRRRFIMSRDEQGACPLHVALMRADKRLVDYLLRRHPEAASAPDYENRNALHYAALAMAAHEAHGDFKLTTTGASDRGAQMQAPHQIGYWQVDENVQVMYGNLIARYGELLDVKDCKGLTGGEYVLNGANQTQVQHVSLAGLCQSGEFVAADALATCCPDYAQLLARYNYVLINERRPGAGRESPPEDGDGREGEEQARDTSGALANRRGFKRSGSSESAPARSSQQRSRRTGAHSSAAGGNQVELAATRSKTTEELVRQLDGELLGCVPVSHASLEARQVAPKPTVGSDSGYPLFGAQSPTSLSYAGAEHPDLADPLASHHQHHHQQRHNLAARRHLRNHKGSLLDELDLSKRSANNHHHHHHHHRHHRRRHKRRGADEAVQSIVGGVIVPTIIHNDKMDEIETYDIIYRRPPANNQKQAASSSSFSSDSSCSLSLASLNGANSPDSDSDQGALSLASSRLAAGRPLPEAPGKASTSQQQQHERSVSSSARASASPAAPRASFSASSSSVSLNGDDDDDPDERDEEEDDRVERLSNEFENRVRREKSELRAKVDQIMNEIKLSAKSGKSSRFLASPSDLSTNSKRPADGNNSVVFFSAQNAASEFDQSGRQREAPGESPTTTTAAAQVRPRGHSKRQSIESHSSGHCSERTCDTASASSSASSSSSAASSRCSNRGASASCSSGSLSATSSKLTASAGSCSSYGCQSSVLNGALGGAVGAISSAASSSLHSSTIKEITAAEQNHLDKRTMSERKRAITKQQVQATGNKQAPDDQAARGHNETHANSANISTSISELTGQLVSKNTYGQTYLHFIASRSQVGSTLYKVLDHGRHLIGERDIFYRTARDVAVQFHLANNVQVLDKYIIDLFISANTGLLRHLLNQGYSPLIHVSDTDGNDIMLILKLLKLDRMIHFLLQMADFQRWRDELHTFIRNGYSAGLTELIRKHADLIRAKSVHARSALHLAVLFDRPGMASELIERDPTCVHCTDNMGRTALHYTYGLNLNNMEEIRALLLKNGASLEARDVKMRTPKYYFIFKREIEEIKRIELELN